MLSLYVHVKATITFAPHITRKLFTRVFVEVDHLSASCIIL